MKTIKKHYLDHPYLSHSIFPENRIVVNEKDSFEGVIENHPKDDTENALDIEDDSIYSLHNQIKK